MKAVKKIEISVLYKRPMPLVVYTMQGDTGREIECTVVDWDIPAGATARVWVVKPSKKVVYSDGKIMENSVVFSLTNQMLAEPGVAICIIEFSSGDDVVSSFPFNLCIDGSARGDGIPSENESTVLEGMFEALGQDAIKALDEAKAEAAAANKSAQDTEKIKNDFTLTAQQATADVNNAGQTQTQCINTAGDTQASRVQAEGATQVQNVQATAAEIAADREQIHTNRDNVEEITHDILSVAGLEVDYETGICTRLAGATGMNAGRDFGRFKPFGGRRRCTVADDGTITSWYGDEDFVEDGSMGQVMVYQPKFFYKVIPLKIDPQTDGIGYHLRKARYYVSAHKHPGFKCHPAFYDADGNETDYILYSAYEGAIYDTSTQTYLRADEQVADFAVDKLSSIAGAKPASGKTQNLTRPNVENLAQNRGAGWHSDLINVESANQILMIIELGIMDTQTGVGNGVVSIPDNPNTENNSVLTGGTSSLGNTTGMADGTNGQVPISYRGVENPWGNIWKFVYGVNIYGNGSMKGGVPYICSDFNFAESKNDENYESAGFTLSNADGCISAMGYSEAYDYLFFPSECLGNVSVPVGDYLWRITNLNGYCIAHFGGIWNSGSIAGGFNWALGNGAGCHSRDIGGRLVYIPTGTPKNELTPKDISKFALTDQASGAMATCMDSADWPLLGVGMLGKCEQVTTTGAQLFDVSTAKDGCYVSDSTGGEGCGTDGVGKFASDYIPVVPACNITFDKKTAWGAWYNAQKQFISGFVRGEPRTITAPENAAYMRFTGYLDSKNVMVNVGDSALPWEPYTGGAPSPSPAYPQEVQETGTYNPETGMYEADMVMTGAQLFNADQFTVEKNGVIFTAKEGTITVKGTATNHTSILLGKATLQPGTYTLSGCPKGGSNAKYQLVLYGERSIYDMGNGSTFNVTAKNDSSVSFYVYAGNTVDLIVNPMLNAGSTALPWEPYQSDTLHLTAGQPWRGIGDVHDEVCERDGVLGTLRCCAILKPTKIIFISEGTNTAKYSATWGEYPKVKGGTKYPGLCNALKWEISQEDTPHFYWGDDSTGAVIYVPKGYTPNPEDFTFYGVLAAPVWEPFPEEVQRTYRKLKSYAGTTHAWTDDPLQPEVSFKYIKDSKLVLGKLEDRLAALETAQAQTTAAFSYLPPEIQAAMIENETNQLMDSI